MDDGIGVTSVGGRRYSLAMEAKGTNGTAVFDGQMLTIRRGMIGNQARGEKVIPLASIGAVQMRKPSFGALMADGVWSVSVLGEMQSSTSKRGRGQARKESRSDENSIIIKPGQVGEFQALTDAINAAKAGGGAPVVQATPVVDQDREAVIAQLRQLGSMHHRGALDDQAFIRELHELLPRL